MSIDCVGLARDPSSRACILMNSPSFHITTYTYLYCSFLFVENYLSVLNYLAKRYYKELCPLKSIHCCGAAVGSERAIISTFGVASTVSPTVLKEVMRVELIQFEVEDHVYEERVSKVNRSGGTFRGI